LIPSQAVKSSMCRSRGIALLLIGANATLLALELVLDGEVRCGREAGD
jgi:hypothetical protein